MTLKDLKDLAREFVDITMTVLLLCLMAYQVTGESMHEWVGIGMTVLLIVHHILNIRWYAVLFKGKYNAYRIVSTAADMLLLLSIVLTAFSGMSMSHHAVPFLYGMTGMVFARTAHLALSYWSPDGAAPRTASPGHDGKDPSEPCLEGRPDGALHDPRGDRILALPPERDPGIPLFPDAFRRSGL